MIVNSFEQSKQQLLELLTTNMEQNTIEYIRQEIRQITPECVPDAKELRVFLLSPDEPTSLTTYQQVLAMDKLLEYAEVSLRMLCDLIRYQQLKKFGIVKSAEEFIDLFRPEEEEC